MSEERRMAIESFADKEAFKIFNRQFSRKLPPEIQERLKSKEWH